MERRETAFRFHTPSGLLVVGPSGCGKTVFTTNLLLNNLELFHTRPSQIHYCYGVWQDGFQPMKERGVKSYEGVPDTDQLKRGFLMADSSCWTISWLKEETIREFWICSPNIHIIKTLPSFTYAKTCFRQENMPRVFPEMLTIS